MRCTMTAIRPDRTNAAPGASRKLVPTRAHIRSSAQPTVRTAAHTGVARLVRLVAEARPELVVVVVLHPRRGQVAVARLQIFVGLPRAAVQQQRPHTGVVADPLHPHPVLAHRRGHRNLPRAPAQPVLPARTIQIPAHHLHAPPELRLPSIPSRGAAVTIGTSGQLQGQGPC